MSSTTLNAPIDPESTKAEKDVEAGKAPVMPVFPEGSLKGWLCIVGAWMITFSTFGYANAFGVYQSYYQLQGYPDQTPSNISWVGSVQLFFLFSFGAVSGPLYDKGYFYYLIGSGSAVTIFCVFMTSLCNQFWQVVLAQGIALGIGNGLLMLPSLSILSQYFMRRRALAMGIAVSGSSVGGICFPIMLNKLIASHGFPYAVRATGYVITGALVVACLLMRTRLPVNPNPPKKPSPKELFQDLPYSILVFAFFITALGLFFPIFYLQVFAETHGIDANLVSYTLAILNAASVFGRTLPNFIADVWGTINLLTLMCAGAGALCFSVFGAGTPGGLIVVAILFGFFSGAFVSLMSPALVSLAKNHSEIGLRIGMGMLVVSLAALSGTPITGALLNKYGFVAPTIWSGVCVCTGAVLFGVSAILQARVKGTRKV